MPEGVSFLLFLMLQSNSFMTTRRLAQALLIDMELADNVADLLLFGFWLSALGKGGGGGL